MVGVYEPGKREGGFCVGWEGGGGWPVAGSQSYISYEGMRCYEDSGLFTKFSLRQGIET